MATLQPQSQFFCKKKVVYAFVHCLIVIAADGVKCLDISVTTKYSC